MRVYAATTVKSFHDAGPGSQHVYAPTAEVVALEPDGTLDDWEELALYCAATASLELLAEDAELGGTCAFGRDARPAPMLRVVAVAEVAAARPAPNPVGLPGRVALPGELNWENCLAIHLDDVGAEPVLAATAQDLSPKNLDQVAELNLEWFDISELAQLRTAFPQ